VVGEAWLVFLSSVPAADSIAVIPIIVILPPGVLLLVRVVIIFHRSRMPSVVGRVGPAVPLVLWSALLCILLFGVAGVPSVDCIG
jgi:hypothetical protein